MRGVDGERRDEGGQFSLFEPEENLEWSETLRPAEGSDGELPEEIHHDTEIGAASSEDDSGGNEEEASSEGEEDDPRFETEEDARIPPGKMFFKIGEVARIVRVKPYVLRYWESEFSWLRPAKTSSRQRMYRRQDVALLLKIKRLRHEERHTIAASRELIKEHRNGKTSRRGKARPRPQEAMAPLAKSTLPLRAEPPAGFPRSEELMAMLAELKSSVHQLLEVVED